MPRFLKKRKIKVVTKLLFLVPPSMCVSVCERVCMGWVGVDMGVQLYTDIFLAKGEPNKKRNYKVHHLSHKKSGSWVTVLIHEYKLYILMCAFKQIKKSIHTFLLCIFNILSTFWDEVLHLFYIFGLSVPIVLLHLIYMLSSFYRDCTVYR